MADTQRLGELHSRHARLMNAGFPQPETDKFWAEVDAGGGDTAQRLREWADLAERLKRKADIVLQGEPGLSVSETIMRAVALLMGDQTNEDRAGLQDVIDLAYDDGPGNVWHLASGVAKVTATRIRGGIKLEASGEAFDTAARWRIEKDHDDPKRERPLFRVLVGYEDGMVIGGARMVPGRAEAEFTGTYGDTVDCQVAQGVVGIRVTDE